MCPICKDNVLLKSEKEITFDLRDNPKQKVYCKKCRKWIKFDFVMAGVKGFYCLNNIETFGYGGGDKKQ